MSVVQLLKPPALALAPLAGLCTPTCDQLSALVQRLIPQYSIAPVVYWAEQRLRSA